MWHECSLSTNPLWYCTDLRSPRGPFLPGLQHHRSCVDGFFLKDVELSWIWDSLKTDKAKVLGREHELKLVTHTVTKQSVMHPSQWNAIKILLLGTGPWQAYQAGAPVGVSSACLGAELLLTWCPLDYCLSQTPSPASLCTSFVQFC